MLKKNNKSVTTNEFDQVVQGTSLTQEAWKRLVKNKMAVLGMVIVFIYAFLAIFASVLPLYPYDEIILDHQDLRPSLTKTAGELMLENKKKNLFFQAWKQKRLVVTEEEDAQIREWIKNNKTNKIWNFLLEEGQRQLDAGTFTWSSSDQKTLDKMEKNIKEEIQVTVDKVYYDSDGKHITIEKADYETVLAIYQEMLGVDMETLISSIKNEVEASIGTTVRASLPEGYTQDDYQAALNAELETLSQADFEKKATENIVGKIEASAQKSATKLLKAQIAEDTAELPFKGKYQISDKLTVKIDASLKHQRRYLLGTDSLGRDLLSRIIYGGRVSIAIGIIGTLTSVIIGILVGALAGYKGGKTDYYLMRFVDIMYGLPYMLIVIICMAVFGRKITNLFFALSLVSWLTIARMVRGQIMSLKNQEYVEAAQSMGASTWAIILKHMIPNSLSVIIVYSTMRIPSFIMEESFLSFLGLGVQAPLASWGSLIGDGVSSMTLYPWKLLIPSVVMCLFLFAMNFFGDGLRDAFDPQSKNQL